MATCSLKFADVDSQCRLASVLSGIQRSVRLDGSDEINAFAPLFKDQLLSVQEEFLKRRSQDKDALLSETIYDYAQELFDTAINFVQ